MARTTLEITFLFLYFPSIYVLDILLTFISGLCGSLDKYNCTRERKHNEATLGEDIKQTSMKIGQSKTLFKCQTIISTVAINSFTLALAKDITFVLVCFENTFCFLCRPMQHFLGKSDIYVDPTASYWPCLCPLWVVVGGWL